MDLNKLKGMSLHKAEQTETADVEDIVQKIAIIGMSAQIGTAQNTEMFWEMIKNGYDMVCDFPEERWKNANELYQKMYFKQLPKQLGQCAYMDRIDLFDADLFNIAPIEAEYMDPVQRIMLESVWSAIEDAGYGGERLKGTKTGVYIGYSNPNIQYNTVVEDADQYTAGVAVSGNVNSIIASRISYLLNLTGPALVVDTACSSSLVAMHLACQQLEKGEVDTAIVGGIRIMMLPRIKDGNNIGIESSTERTHTFDAKADGTGGGEGVITFLLKPYVQAKKDKDNIYAVIRGSSMNQDGASVGITAPNAAAQQQVIRTAWRNAGIDPESISYIEAHGTGTKLGDPVEITGIEEAFQKYTDKKQFCAIGSVKSNIGHLDCAAGLAGVLKVVLMLQHKQIVPTIHFTGPNAKIPFISSPVYIQDQLTDWEIESNGIRRAGISSFGMSGTNCHVVIEEEMKPKWEVKKEQDQLLCISGKTKKAAEDLFDNYQKYLQENRNTDWKAFCYTANTGRGHYKYRIAIVADSVESFLKLSLQQLSLQQLSSQQEKNIWIGEHRIEDQVKEGQTGVIGRQAWKELSKKATQIWEENSLHRDSENRKSDLCVLAEHYVKGADIQWEASHEIEQKLSIPVYAFQHKPYWHTIKEQIVREDVKMYLHPLVHEVALDSYDRRIYQTILSNENCWELKEHVINGIHVLPGTALIEIARFAAADYLATDALIIEDLVYMMPLTCKEQEQIILHTGVIQENEDVLVRAHSKNENGEWNPHIEFKVKKAKELEKRVSETAEMIQNRCQLVDITRSEHNDNSIVRISGQRWNNISHVYGNENELLLEFQMRKELEADSENYYLYPSLLDPAINSGNYLLQETYLPFSCQWSRFYDKLPAHFYSHIVRNHTQEESKEFASFDITLFKEDQVILGELKNYCIKRVHEVNFLAKSSVSLKDMFHQREWILANEKSIEDQSMKNGQVLLITRKKDERVKNLIDALGSTCIQVQIGSILEKQSEKSYVVDGTQGGFLWLMKEIGQKNIRSIIFNFSEQDNGHSLQEIFTMFKSLIDSEVRQQIDMILLSLEQDAQSVADINENAYWNALKGMGKCLESEYKSCRVRTIEVDHATSIKVLMEEIYSVWTHYSVAFVEGQKYIEQLKPVLYNKQLMQKSLELKKNGVYILTGGLGGMGLAFAEHLVAARPDITLVLCNRSYSEEDILAWNVNISDEQTYKKQCIERLKNTGAQILIAKVDVADYEAMKDMIQSVKKQYGAICGVVHTAGVAGNGFVMNKTWKVFEDVIRPKVNGTLVLHQLTLEEPLEFFVMCSSYTTLFGAPGQSDYTAANGFLDAFAYDRRKKGLPALTINWTGWSESGMAYQNKVDSKDMFVEFATNVEGVQAFEYALKENLTQIYVGKLNNEGLMKQLERYKGRVQLSNEIGEKKQTIKSDTLNTQASALNKLIISGKRVEKLTEIERNIVTAWVETLKVTEVNIHDKFFESGGNSLLASYLHKEIDKFYPNIMVITDIFVYSSIEEIANFIELKMKETEELEQVVEEDATEIEDMVAKFMNGDINLDELDAMIDI